MSSFKVIIILIELCTKSTQKNEPSIQVSMCSNKNWKAKSNQKNFKCVTLFQTVLQYDRIGHKTHTL